MEKAIGETERRRAKQVLHNEANGITPETVKRQLDDVMGAALAREFIPVPREDQAAEEPLLYMEDKAFEREVARLEAHMRDLAGQMNFEAAAALRDRIHHVRRDRLL
jgi:excinuclease ABC subunit B